MQPRVAVAEGRELRAGNEGILPLRVYALHPPRHAESSKCQRHRRPDNDGRPDEQRDEKAINGRAHSQ